MEEKIESEELLPARIDFCFGASAEGHCLIVGHVVNGTRRHRADPGDVDSLWAALDPPRAMARRYVTVPTDFSINLCMDRATEAVCGYLDASRRHKGPFCACQHGRAVLQLDTIGCTTASLSFSFLLDCTGPRYTRILAVSRDCQCSSRGNCRCGTPSTTVRTILAIGNRSGRSGVEISSGDN